MASNVPRVTFFLFFFCFSIFLAKSQKVPAMYVFGDSLVDVGNNNHLPISFAKANFPHNGVDYPGGRATGRFCNGKNAADFIAEKLGLPTPQPYLSLVSKPNRNNGFLAGVSFASGGSGIFNGTDDQLKQSITLSKQVVYYSRVHEALVQQLGSPGAVQVHSSKSLFTIVTGSNDIFDYFKSGSNLAKNATPQQFVTSMLSTLLVQIKILYNLGARKFVMVGLGAIGCCPAQRNQNNTECNEQTNYWSVKYNDGLKSELNRLKTELTDFNYAYFDTYSVILDMIQKPATYGFSEVRAACCGLGKLRAEFPCLSISKYCSNRNDHIFWDFVHPTERTNGMIVDIILSGSQQYVVPMNVKQLLQV